MSQLPLVDDPLEEEPGFGGPPLAAYVDMLRRRRWLIAACLLVALLAAGVVTWLSTPMYRATTLPNLDPPGASSFEVAGAPARAAAPDLEMFATEAQLMRNREVAERVVTKLKLAGAPEATTASPDAVTAEALRIRAGEDTPELHSRQ